MQPRSPGEREVSPVEGALDERNTLCQYWMKRSIAQGNISRTQREHITCCPGVFLCLKTKAAYDGDTPVYFWIKLLLFLEHLEKKGTHKCSSEELYVITVTCAFTSTLFYAVCVKDRDPRVWRHGTLLKRLFVISALIQMDADSFLFFFFWFDQVLRPN